MALLSPYDPNDLIYETLSKSPPPNRAVPGSVRQKVVKIKDQGTRPTCTAVAASSLMESLTSGDESAEWIWYHRASHGFDGMSARDSLQILKKIGSIAESIFPYNSEQEPIGSDYMVTKKISCFAKVISLEGLKTALVDHIVITVLPLYNYDLEFWVRRKKQEKPICFHSVLIVGYTKHGFIIQNSWGSDWGIDGQWVMPFGHFDIIREAWIAAL